MDERQPSFKYSFPALSLLKKITSDPELSSSAQQIRTDWPQQLGLVATSDLHFQPVKSTHMQFINEERETRSCL
jgi:hypothetical protein